MKKIIIALSIILISFAVIVFTLSAQNNSFRPEIKENAAIPAIKKPKKYTVSKPIKEGQTYSKIMSDISIDNKTAKEIFDATAPVYDLSKIQAGKNIYLTFAMENSELIEMMYPINYDQELYVDKDPSTSTPNIWNAEVREIDYEIEEILISGEIKTSLYEEGLRLGLEDKTIIEFANVFEYSIDYAYDVREGDTFMLVYEKKFREGNYAMPGKILAGQFLNSGKKYQAYYFEESEDNKGYFDEQGNSVQKMFLRAPVAFKYISSGFTTGLRYISAFNISTGHRAIDYATPAGTPIRSVGDGTVIFAGWSKVGYGYLTSIRHNSTYTTNYAHQSKIAVKVGQKVKQGQVIGYVGSTGLSTGPHLHYEMVKNGVKINPLTEILPPGKPIKEENKERFNEIISEHQKLFSD